MKRLICNVFAFKEAYQTSMQMGKSGKNELTDVYMKNIFVSLTSAKLHNPEDDVMLFTNCAVSDTYAELFRKQGIGVRTVPFDSFVMPKDFVWSLAYFKLCCLKYIAGNLDYDKVLLLDADTVTLHSYGELWMEAEHGLLLFPVGHSYLHKDRAAIREDYHTLYPEENGNVVHYGGEFVCGSKENLSRFVKCCEQVYNTIREKEFSISETAGDEAILSIAALRVPVIEAGAYIYRYWTDDFYLVSTNTVSNPVAIWHIPNEKKDGFPVLYEYYQKHGSFPNVCKTARIMGIVRAKRPNNKSTLRKKVMGKIRKIRS